MNSNQILHAFFIHFSKVKYRSAKKTPPRDVKPTGKQYLWSCRIIVVDQMEVVVWSAWSDTLFWYTVP